MKKQSIKIPFATPTVNRRSERPDAPPLRPYETPKRSIAPNIETQTGSSGNTEYGIFS
jgi:hypothetical protein